MLSCLAISSQSQRLTDGTPNSPPVQRWNSIHLLFLNTSHEDGRMFSPHQQCSGIGSPGRFYVHQGSHHVSCAGSVNVLSQVPAGQSSSLGQVDDRHPLVHAAALSAESVHFAQGGVLPRCRVWASDQDTVQVQGFPSTLLPSSSSS